jgi:hypothetical protein
MTDPGRCPKGGQQQQHGSPPTHLHELHLPLGPRNIRRLGWAKRLVGATSPLLIHTTLAAATTQPKSIAHTGLIASSYSLGCCSFLSEGWDGFLMWVGFLSCHGVCIFWGCHRSLIVFWKSSLVACAFPLLPSVGRRPSVTSTWVCIFWLLCGISCNRFILGVEIILRIIVRRKKWIFSEQRQFFWLVNWMASTLIVVIYVNRFNAECFWKEEC